MIKIFICAFVLFAGFNGQASASDCGHPDLDRPASVTDVVARVQQYYPQGLVKPKSEQEAACALKFARQNKIQIAIKTGGYSQGGQWALNDGLILDMSSYKGIKVNVREKHITVKAGNTWAEIQKAIHPYGLAVKVMQSSNIFPVGGALGINCHGRDIHFGQIVNTVNWIKVLLADGQTLIASPEKNQDIFKEVIGGMGLKGVVLEANLQLRPNKIYETIVLRNVPATEISQVFTLMKTNPSKLKKYVSKEDLDKIATDMDKLTPEKISLGYGRATNLNSQRNDYLEASLFYLFAEVPAGKISPKAKLKLKEKESYMESKLMPIMMELQRNFEAIKSVREKLEKMLMRTSGDQANLNYLMNPPVEFLLYKVREQRTSFSSRVIRFFRNALRRFTGTAVASTDVLKEYFIPNNPSSVNSFLNTVQRVVKKYDLNLMNITYRIVPKTPKSKAPLLNYAKSEVIAFVFDFHIALGPNRWEKTTEWTRELVHGALEAGGVQYLAYEPQASYEQFIQAYPEALIIFRSLMAQKDLNLFMNRYMQVYYRQYAF